MSVQQVGKDVYRKMLVDNETTHAMKRHPAKQSLGFQIAFVDHACLLAFFQQ